MWFHFCLKNNYPQGKLTVFDLIEFCSVGLRELGHFVTIDDNLIAPDAINIFVEYFTDDLVNELEESKIVYGILATEIFDGKGFNWRREPEWLARWNNFEKAARNAAFIWAIFENSIQKYSEYAPTGLFEFGYSDGLLPKKTFVKPDTPFVFCGTRTPRRAEIIDRLRQHVKVVWPDKMLPSKDYFRLISRAQTALALKLDESWPTLSPSRIARLILARKNIVAENTNEIIRPANLLPRIPEGIDFVDFVLTRTSENWQQNADEMFGQYRAEMPLREIVKKMLDLTIYQNDRINLSFAPQKNSDRRKLQFNLPPILVERVGAYNIVLYVNKFHIIPLDYGDFDLQHEQQNIKNRKIRVTNNLEKAWKIAAGFRSKCNSMLAVFVRIKASLYKCFSHIKRRLFKHL